MLIKVLVENTPGEELPGEHGLCLYIEYRGRKYLIDSGASDLFAQNADKMGVDLSGVDMAFLSHAHYDHSGGYGAFFELNKTARVYLQRAAKNRCYSQASDPAGKYIGIPEGMLSTYADRFNYIDGYTAADDGVYIVPHSSSGILERALRTHMCVSCGQEFIPDDFSHEQTVVFEDEGGLIGFNSCSHAGVDIIIEEIKKAFPGKKIRAYFGGFHMMGASGPSSSGYSKEEVQEVAQRLKDSCDAVFYSGHCTGTVAYEWLKEVLGDRLEAFRSGRVIELR